MILFNCFVMGAISDDMNGIFESLKEAALTMQQGGGIGYDFSTLRPEGDAVKGVGADASGPLSFMDVWDAMCRTIKSAGARRGAMMDTMRCDHPDIETFIDAKRDGEKLRMSNLSVLVTDAFMAAAVKTDDDWALRFNEAVYRTLPARALWDRIKRATYETAELGVNFIDRINATNNLYYCEDIAATNPCGEQPLPPYGACLLGSINLAQFITDAFTPQANMDIPRLEAVVPVTVRMLDKAIDASRFPLKAQKEEALAKRRIGLGVTVLIGALAMCGSRYGSAQAVDLTRDWMSCLRRSAYMASTKLVDEKGAFPLYFAYQAFRDQYGKDATPPDTLVEVEALLHADHLAIQAAAQAFIDSSISKTINLPKNISFEAFQDVYRDAYEAGCKGCKTYRPNSVTGAILSVEPANVNADADRMVYMTQPLDRPDVIEDRTYKIIWPDSDHAIYITVNDDVQDGRRRPFEIFINSKNMLH